MKFLTEKLIIFKEAYFNTTNLKVRPTVCHQISLRPFVD